MKKTSIICISARLVAGIALLTSTALTAQSTTFGAFAGDTDTASLDDMFMQMHRQLDRTNNVANELIGLINDKHLVDPISTDSFDFVTVGEKLLNAGMITDIDSWNDAASIIEGKGFAAYVEQIQVRLSTVDRQLSVIDTKLVTWANLSDDERYVAVTNNTDANIVPTLARLYATTTKFHNFAMAGMIVFAELSYMDKGSSLVGHSTTVKQTESVDA